jgi:hypothetical protein
MKCDCGFSKQRQLNYINECMPVLMINLFRKAFKVEFLLHCHQASAFLEVLDISFMTLQVMKWIEEEKSAKAYASFT